MSKTFAMGTKGVSFAVPIDTPSCCIYVIICINHIKKDYVPFVLNKIIQTKDKKNEKNSRNKQQWYLRSTPTM